MCIKNIIQGSEEWLEIRKKCITSTDASIINETNTFNGNSPYKLWQRKLGLIDEEQVNDKMLEGIELEVKARDFFNSENKTNFNPAVLFQPQNDWLMASIDGYDDNSDSIIEIKCGIKAYHDAQQQKVPNYYYDQIQHALFVSGKKSCKYLCYREEEIPIILEVQRNDFHIEALFDKEKEFYEYLLKMVPPPCKENDYICIDNEEANDAANKWKEAKLLLDEAKKQEKKCRQDLLDYTDDGNCIFPKGLIKINYIYAKGTYDMKKICNKYNILEQELETYRKDSISYPKITIISS